MKASLRAFFSFLSPCRRICWRTESSGVSAVLGFSLRRLVDVAGGG